MELKKRDCGMELKLVPYGGGWTDVYFNVGNDKLYFIISSVWSDQFSKLLEALYYLHPCQNDPGKNDDIDYYVPSELAFIGRSGTDRENANLIVFLASDEASYISAQNIQIDGCRKKQ